MATNPSRVMQAKRVQLWLGIVGSSIPSTLAAPGAGWFDVGLTNQESCRFRVSPQFEAVMAHQSDFPVKIVETGTAAGVDIDLLEWSGANIKSVLGGGTITEPTAGLYKYAPPRFGGREEVSGLLDVVDGAFTYRFPFPRLFNQSETEFTFNKSPESRLPLRLTVLGDDGVDPWNLITNNPAFDPTP